MVTWRNNFSQLLNVHRVNEVWQTEIDTAEPLVPEPSAFEVQMATGKLKTHKSPSIDQMPAELIKAGGRTIRSDIYELINSIWNKDELPEEWNESIVVPIYKKGDKTYCSNYRGISLCQPGKKNIMQHPAVKFNSICRGNYWGSSLWISTQQIKHVSYISHSANTWKKNGNTMK